MSKGIRGGIVSALLAVAALASVHAASREELASIRVRTAADFKYWNADSPTKQKIVKFVTEATDPKGGSFIPEEDRVAVFDLDGTLYCETAPYYFQEMMYLHRALDDKSYKPGKRERTVAKKVRPLIMEKKPVPQKLAAEFAKFLHKSYAGMTAEEYSAYVRKFMETEEVGLTNLKRGEAYYLPMVEVVSYLRNNGFTVYMVSACEREILRCLVGGVLDVPLDRMIGSNVGYVSSKQGGESADAHSYDRGSEKVVRSGVFLGENGRNNKIFSIVTEIGRRPVLAFGNSGGDCGMLDYNLQNDRHRAESFYVLCDDTERELGNLERAKKDRDTCEKHGWNPISMRSEFKTIYGDGVKLAK